MPLTALPDRVIFTAKLISQYKNYFMANDPLSAPWNARLLRRILYAYYLDGVSQAEIANRLGLSTAKVNRLVRQAREQGFVEVRITIPGKEAYHLERRLEERFGLREAVVVPGLAEEETVALQRVGEAAAGYLLSRLQGGETVCMGGGRAMLALVQAIHSAQPFQVQMVPAIGGVQGAHFSDVNTLASELARRLGGQAVALHAPAFVETAQEREAVYSLRHVRETLALAENAQVALVGIGSLVPETSSYFQFTSLSLDAVARVVQEQHGSGEILAQMFDVTGQPVARPYAGRVIGLPLSTLRAIPLVVGVAVGRHKVASILGALRGGYIHTLVTDEITAEEVLKGSNS